MDARNIGFSPGFYPQILGTGAGETDSVAGKFARLYIKGISKWEIEFFRADESGGLPILPGPPEPPEDPPDRDRLSIGGVSGVRAMRQLSRIR
jgi:hypothetical protein